MCFDLRPASRINGKFVKSVPVDNEGHVKEQIYRPRDHWILKANMQVKELCCNDCFSEVTF